MTTASPNALLFLRGAMIKSYRSRQGYRTIVDPQRHFNHHGYTEPATNFRLL